MKTKLDFFLKLAKMNTVLARRLTVQGLSFSEFMILFYLDKSSDNKLRRIDLADRLGLTASGITRMLIPMEKIGLIERDTNDLDARARFASLTPAGKRLLTDAARIMDEKIEEITSDIKSDQIKKFTELLMSLAV